MATVPAAVAALVPEGYAASPEHVWTYKDKAGATVLVVARFDATDGVQEKTFRQLSYDKGGKLVAKGMAGMRPLFNLGELLARPDAPALIVEGERTATAAAQRFPAWVVVTSAGGSKAAHKTDWSPLQGRDAVIWPDNDEPGRAYAHAVQENLPHARVVSVPPSWPAHWDLADPPPDGADLPKMLADAGNGVAEVPRTTGSGNGKGPISPNAKRQKAANRALADKYCNVDGSPLTEEQIKAKVADLDKIAYDRERRAIAEAAGVRAGTVDALRADARAGGGSPSFPEWAMLPWPEAVPDGDKLADEILAQARRYVAWPGGGAEILALWVLLAHAFDSFDIVPYLAFISPTPACGKTTSFKLLARLTPRAMIASNISGPAIPRMVEAHVPTLLIDELDSLGKDQAETLRSILNAGHDREGARYTRCEGEANEPRTYLTWCPKALAKIRALPDTLVSRSIVVHMRRRAPSERIERLRPRRHTAHLEELRRRAARWATDHADLLRDAEPAMPEALFNREADNWAPLFAIADACGGDWPDRIREVAVRFSGAEEEALGVELLADIRKIHGLHPANAHSSKDLALWLGEMEDRPWAEYWRDKPITQPQLAKLLKPFGIKSGPIRTGTGAVARGYYASAFAEAFARYLAPETPT